MAGLHHFPGIAEVAGGFGVGFGVPHSTAAIGLISSCWAPSRKKSSYAHGVLGEKASGWHYDLLFVVMNLVILFTTVEHTCYEVAPPCRPHELADALSAY